MIDVWPDGSRVQQADGEDLESPPAWAMVATMLAFPAVAGCLGSGGLEASCGTEARSRIR